MLWKMMWKWFRRVKDILKWIFLVMVFVAGILIMGRFLYILGLDVNRVERFRAVTAGEERNAILVSELLITRLNELARGLEFAPAWEMELGVEPRDWGLEATGFVGSGRLEIGEVKVPIGQVLTFMREYWPLPWSPKGVIIDGSVSKTDRTIVVISSARRPGARTPLGLWVIERSEKSIRSLVDDLAHMIVHRLSWDEELRRFRTGTASWRAFKFALEGINQSRVYFHDPARPASFEKSVQLLRKSLQEDRSYRVPQYYLGLLHHQRATRKHDPTERAKAREIFSALAEMDPYYAPAYFGFAITFTDDAIQLRRAKREQDALVAFNTAREYYHRAQKLNSGVSVFLLAEAGLLLAFNDPTGAENLFRNAMAIETNAHRKQSIRLRLVRVMVGQLMGPQEKIARLKWEFSRAESTFLGKNREEGRSLLYELARHIESDVDYQPQQLRQRIARELLALWGKTDLTEQMQPLF